MQTDGQLYKVLHKGEREFPPDPPPCGPELSKPPATVCPNSIRTQPCQKRRSHGLLSGIGRDELLLLGIIILLVSDKNDTDIPLVLALIYVLITG